MKLSVLNCVKDLQITELQDEDGEQFEYVLKSKNKFGLKQDDNDLKK